MKQPLGTESSEYEMIPFHRNSTAPRHGAGFT
jgi:hypothetical protein